MKKVLSLIKACMSSDMQLFRVKSKNGKNNSLLPIILAIFFAGYMFMISDSMLDNMQGAEFVFISLIVILTAVLTLTEGIYKSGNLLFNCKDDNLLLSLPISKRTVLFIRIFKFYTFELLYNSLYLVPAIVAYALHVEVGMTYFIVSLLMIFLLPIIPIVLSCIIGFITTGLSSRFKFKNATQIVLSMAILIGVLYVSMNLNTLIKALTKNAKSINDLISMIYYPAGVYVKAITNFNILDILIFAIINIALLIIMIFVLSKVYFKINSRLKKVEKKTSSKKGKIVYKANSQTVSLVKKELQKFFKTPVFITNAGFGLVLFIIICLVAAFKLEVIIAFAINYLPEVLIAADAMKIMPSIALAIILFGTLTTSITSSLISLEGKNINILKSLPIDPRKIIMSKVYASLVIMLPAIIIGTLILIIKFQISIIDALLLIAIAIVLSLISCIIGIIINLKYPKLDAENDTEVVKQSTSSMVSVFTGFFLLGISLSITFFFVSSQLSMDILLIIMLGGFGLLLLLLCLYLNKKGVKLFNKLTI